VVAVVGFNIFWGIVDGVDGVVVVFVVVVILVEVVSVLTEVDVVATVVDVVVSVLGVLDAALLAKVVVVFSSWSGVVVDDFNVALGDIKVELIVEIDEDDSEAAVEVWLLAEAEIDVSGIFTPSEDRIDEVFNS